MSLGMGATESVWIEEPNYVLDYGSLNGKRDGLAYEKHA